MVRIGVAAETPTRSMLSEWTMGNGRYAGRLWYGFGSPLTTFDKVNKGNQGYIGVHAPALSARTTDIG